MMRDIVKPGERARHIWTLLIRHSALSFKTMHKLMDPPIARRRLRSALQRLIQSGSVERKRYNMGRGYFYIYAISEPARSMLEITHVRLSDLAHNDLCSIVHEQLIRLFPSIKLFREQQIIADPDLHKVLNYQGMHDEVIPDLLMRVPKDQNSTGLTVAIEVERTQKSVKRLFRKLYRYAARTGLDGVIYFCETRRLSEVLRTVFQEKVSIKAQRIGHYRDHFILFATAPDMRDVATCDLKNAAGQNVSIVDWVEALARTPMRERGDQNVFARAHQGLRNQASVGALQIA